MASFVPGEVQADHLSDLSRVDGGGHAFFCGDGQTEATRITVLSWKPDSQTGSKKLQEFSFSSWMQGANSTELSWKLCHASPAKDMQTLHRNMVYEK